MTFGAWRGISFVSRKRQKEFNTEVTEKKKRRIHADRDARLGQVGDFFVEVGESGFQGFSMVGVGCGSQIVGDAGTGHLQIADALLPEVLFGALMAVV